MIWSLVCFVFPKGTQILKIETVVLLPLEKSNQLCYKMQVLYYCVTSALRHKNVIYC